MTVIADFLAQAKAIDTELPRVAPSRSVYGHLHSIPDFDYPAGLSAANAAQSLAALDVAVDGGTYKLTFTFQDGTTFTTGNIAYNGNAAAITTAINTAAAGITGWTNGDIVVGGGPLSTTPVTFTFSGNSVKSKRVLATTLDGSLLLEGASPATSNHYPAAATVTAAGNPDRAAWAILVGLGIVTAASVPLFGADATVTALVSGTFPHNLDQGAVRAIAEEIAIVESNVNTKAALLSALGL